MDYGITDIFTLLGSLGFFLFGMKTMSDALMEVAGDKMRNILAKMTSNRLFAVLTGFLITSVIQSSSATTLMVVSFANSSLLTLVESIGVIMGANIGTTVTAWLITILGFKVSMSAISLPLVGLGFLLTFSENKTTRYWGSFVVGFAILFIGLQFLKDSVPDIGSNSDALAFLSKYTQMGYLSVLIFVIIGTVLTVVIQSSSATMALTLVMCNEGWIPFDMAAAMVLGENIGTTITANLAALVANYRAKRTARAHFIFNILGVIWMLALFYPFLNAIEWLVVNNGSQSPFLQATAVPVALASFHTAFNIVNTSVLIWFVKPIAKIVKRLVPATAEDEGSMEKAKYLSKVSLKYPQTAIAALFRESVRLFEKSTYEAVVHGISVHRSNIESNKKLGEIIDKSKPIELDLDALYYNKIKKVYNEIIEYGTTLQSNFELKKDKIERIRNILLANRKSVQLVKSIAPLHKNMSKFIVSDNYHIRKEYNTFRKLIIKTIREIQDIQSEDNAKKKHFKKLAKLMRKAERSDVLIDGSINDLVRKNLITSEMATSLINDSGIVKKIVKGLIEISEMLYLPKDVILNQELEKISNGNDGLLTEHE